MTTSNDASQAKARRRGQQAAAAAGITIALALVPAVGLVAMNYSLPLALRMLALASLLGGLLVFVTHGHRRVTAAGLYCLTAGLMTGAGAWYWAGQVPPEASREGILLAALSLYASTAVMYVVFWLRGVPDASNAESQPPMPPKMAWGFRVLGLILFLVGAATQPLGLALGTLTQAIAEVGVILFAASLLLSGDIRLSKAPIRTLAVGAALVVFYLVLFGGYGRLRLAALVITVGVIAQFRLRTRIKALALVAFVPMLIFFGSIGQERYAAQIGDPTAEAAASGLGSLVNPLATYGQLSEHQVDHGYGSTFLAEFTVLVPRSMWPDKPVQFGAVIVEELRPDRVLTGLSMPCLSACEWYYNFSWVGIFLMIPVIGFGIRILDRWMLRRGSGRWDQPSDVLIFVVLAILVGSIADLAWGGTATWVVRNSQRLLALLPFVFWCYLAAKSRRAKRPEDQPYDGATRMPPHLTRSRRAP